MIQEPDEFMGCMLIVMIILAVFTFIQFLVETYM